MMSSVFALYLPACVDAAELSGILVCPEFLGAWEADGSMVLYWNAEGAEILSQVQSAVRSLGGNLPEESIQFHPVVDQDWNAMWAASVQPIRVGRRIGIRPSWAAMDLPENGIE